jgi:hypothetical protein
MEENKNVYFYGPVSQHKRKCNISYGVSQNDVNLSDLRN